MTTHINELRDCYKGQTGYIVGKGPSLINATQADFGSGVVITINHAVLKLRTLGISNQIFCMQKDGGIYEVFIEGSTVNDVNKYKAVDPCPLGPCPDVCNGRMIRPILPEKLLIHEYESKYCYQDYPERYIFDAYELGLKWNDPSATQAIKIMELFGVGHLKLMCFDSITRNDARNTANGRTIGGSDSFYLSYAKTEMLRAVEVSTIQRIEWVTPKGPLNRYLSHLVGRS